MAGLGPTTVTREDAAVAVGDAEIRVVTSDGTWLIAPTMVLHYVMVHAYRPPDVFIEAVNSGRFAPSPSARPSFAPVRVKTPERTGLLGGLRRHLADDLVHQTERQRNRKVPGLIVVTDHQRSMIVNARPEDRRAR